MQFPGAFSVQCQYCCHGLPDGNKNYIVNTGLGLELEMTFTVYHFTPKILQMRAQIRKYYAVTGCLCRYYESRHISKVKVN